MEECTAGFAIESMGLGGSLGTSANRRYSTSAVLALTETPLRASEEVKPGHASQAQSLWTLKIVRWFVSVFSKDQTPLRGYFKLNAALIHLRHRPNIKLRQDLCATMCSNLWFDGGGRPIFDSASATPKPHASRSVTRRRRG